MRIVLGDAEGNVLGTQSILGVSFHVVDNGLTNTNSINVTAIRQGMLALVTFLDIEDNVLEAQGIATDRYGAKLAVNDTCVFRPGTINLIFPIAIRAPLKLEDAMRRQLQDDRLTRGFKRLGIF